MKRRCKNPNCRCQFEVSARHPEQQYCSAKECQRLRKTKWQRQKMATDKDYRQNQAECQARWKEKNPDYWKNYRKRNSAYTKINQEKQRPRNLAMRNKQACQTILHPIAKMDAIETKHHIISGKYRLIPLDEMDVKMDAIIVKIEDISAGYT